MSRKMGRRACIEVDLSRESSLDRFQIHRMERNELMSLCYPCFRQNEMKKLREQLRLREALRKRQVERSDQRKERKGLREGETKANRETRSKWRD